MFLSNSLKPLVVIPARLRSERLPDKPLALIGGVPMVVHCLHRAKEAGIGDVIVAAAESEIVDAVHKAGGEAILTDPNLPSGSDRVAAALEEYDSQKYYNYVVNFQGDLPLFPSEGLRYLVDKLTVETSCVRTLVTRINSEDERNDPGVVKVQVGFDRTTPGTIGRAVGFSRAVVPWGEGEHWHHIGIYGYPRRILEEFVQLAPSVLEKRERLEQLRLLENGYCIEAVIIADAATGVDTPQDLAHIREIWSRQS